MGTIKGLDTATSLNSTIINALANNGYKFVGRYLIGKYAMTNNEAKAISKKMTVFSIAQRVNNSPGYFTVAQGSQDASDAIWAAKSLGQPDGTAIYAVVDYDASTSEIQNNISKYMNAVKSVFDTASINTLHYKLGIYGSKRVLKAFENICPYRWLTNNAWGAGASAYTNYNIRQDTTDQKFEYNSAKDSIIIDIDSAPNLNSIGGWKI